MTTIHLGCSSRVHGDTRCRGRTALSAGRQDCLYNGGAQRHRCQVHLAASTTAPTTAAAAARAMGPVPEERVAGLLGCYSETKDHLQFKHEALVHSRNVTIENCASACHSLRFPVAGIDSNHCMCGTARELNPRSTRPMAECEVTNCSGDSSEKCGGNGRLLAYNFTCQHSAAASAVTQQQQGLEQPATQCGGGVDIFPLNKTIPNVLLIGDSVMFAHIGPVVKQIFDRCELAPDFCENSTEILPRGRE
eukprot:COSAG01_NODE_1005_length_12174_cov_40.917267_12_plen_249_part_00